VPIFVGIFGEPLLRGVAVKRHNADA
jgi:hypothetical protein